MADVTINRRWGTDRHAPRPALPPGVRAGLRVSQYDPDAIERVCAFCTLTQDGGEWGHDPACILARRKRTA